MIRLLRRVSSGVLVVALACATTQSREALPEKLVFVRGTSIFSALADGTGLHELVRDAPAESMPKWSPDGTKIAFRMPGEIKGVSRSIANLVVIDERGTQLNSLPVYAIGPDGVELAGMLSVLTIGWHGPAAVFATGNINPHLNDYRAFGIEDAGPRAWVQGLTFASCPSVSSVAYVNDPRQSGPKGYQVLVDEERVFEAGRVGPIIDALTWTGDCQRLAFRLKGERGELVVLSRKAKWRVEARAPWPATPDQGRLVGRANDFVVLGSSSARVYDARTGVLKLAPGVDRDMEIVETRRAEVLARLGAVSADWWGPGMVPSLRPPRAVAKD